MDLFSTPDTVQVLLDDVEGGVRYWPAVVEAPRAEDWFARLRDGAQWQSQRRPMYDRIVEVPRLLAAYPLDLPCPGLPLAEMLACVQARAPAPYNTVGLNLYRDGRDSVAMHHDTLQTLEPGAPIALVSLGAPRRMHLRPRDGGPSLGVDLLPGSLLAMSHASQLTHLHGIPKTSRAVAPRISVVFRMRPAAHMEAKRYGPHWQR